MDYAMRCVKRQQKLPWAIVVKGVSTVTGLELTDRFDYHN
jgi:hypothetical protein